MFFGLRILGLAEDRTRAGCETDSLRMELMTVSAFRPARGGRTHTDLMRKRSPRYASCASRGSKSRLSCLHRRLRGHRRNYGRPAVGGLPSDPLVRENVTVKLPEHTYVIPDGNVGGVPNAGIVVGDPATPVIDSGLGRRNGEAVAREVAKISKNTETYGAFTRFHPDHPSGYLAFPTANYVKSTVQETELGESSMQMIQTLAIRTPMMGELL